MPVARGLGFEIPDRLTGNGEEKAMRLPRFALHPKLATVRGDDALRNEEAEPGASAVAAPVSFEDVRQLRRLDATTGVAHFEGDAVRALLGPQEDVPRFRRELQGIADDVAEDLQ